MIDLLLNRGSLLGGGGGVVVHTKKKKKISVAKAGALV